MKKPFDVQHALQEVTNLWNGKMPHEEDFLFFRKFFGSDRPVVLLDCGANAGQSVVSFLMSCPQGRVISFEPNLIYRPVLEGVQALLGADRFEFHMEGLSDAEADHDLYIPHVDGIPYPQEASMDLSQYKKPWVSDRLKSYGELLEIISIKAHFATADSRHLKIDAIKIDAEGAEMLVLKGMRQMILECKPIFLIENNDWSAVTHFLSEFGYKPYQYKSSENTLNEMQGTSANCFYLLNEHFDMQPSIKIPQGQIVYTESVSTAPLRKFVRIRVVSAIKWAGDRARSSPSFKRFIFRLLRRHPGLQQKLRRGYLENQFKDQSQPANWSATSTDAVIPLHLGVAGDKEFVMPQPAPNGINANMYTESDDFKEKQKIYADMGSCISKFLGRDWLELLNDGMALGLGGSGGLLSGMLSTVASRVMCTDVVDTQSKYEGQFGKLLKEKFERNGRSLNLGKIEFHVSDAQHLIYRDEQFDFVFTQNALEHIPDPLAALKEAFRVLKPGGFFYATFDPVWTADSGSHFIDFVKEPWLHILLTDDEFCEKMRKGGAQDWQLASYRNDMNRLPSSYYRQQIPLLLGGLAKKFELEDWRGCTVESFINHDNRTKAASKLNCDPEDLLIRGFRLVAAK